MKVSGVWEQVVFVQKLGRACYVIRASDANVLRSPTYRVVVHANQLRNCHPLVLTRLFPHHCLL